MALSKLKSQVLPGKLTLEVSLDQIQIGKITPELKSALEELKDLRELSMSLCKLQSLKLFPVMGQLKVLVLTDNRIGHQLGHLKDLKALQRLHLSNCGVRTVKDLEPLKGLPLKQLDLQNNPIQDQTGYREKVFEMFPTLISLDEKDRNGKQVELQEEEDSDDSQDEEDESGFIESGDDEDSNQGDQSDQSGDQNGDQEGDEDDDDEDDAEADDDQEDDKSDEEKPKKR